MTYKKCGSLTLHQLSQCQYLVVLIVLQIGNGLGISFFGFFLAFIGLIVESNQLKSIAFFIFVLNTKMSVPSNLTFMPLKAQIEFVVFLWSSHCFWHAFNIIIKITLNNDRDYLSFENLITFLVCVLTCENNIVLFSYPSKRIIVVFLIHNTRYYRYKKSNLTICIAEWNNPPPQ